MEALTAKELEDAIGFDRLDPPYDLQGLVEESATDATKGVSEMLTALVTLALLPTRISRLSYSVRASAYFNGQQQLTMGDMQKRIFAESQRTATRMERRTELLLLNRISLQDWQRQMSEDILASHFRLTQAGAGTAARVSRQHIQEMKVRIQQQIGSLADLAKKLEREQSSEKNTLYRARRFGFGIGSAFWLAFHISRSDDRFMARRFLDPSAAHCPDCPEYVQREWTPARDVVPVGVNCRCGGNCRCRVEYRLVNLSDRLV